MTVSQHQEHFTKVASRTLHAPRCNDSLKEKGSSKYTQVKKVVAHQKINISQTKLPHSYI